MILEESLLASEFRQATSDLAKKLKDPSISDEQGCAIAYPTRFLPLDYANGARVFNTHLYNDVEYCYDSIGIGEGTINMLIGKPGCGKTTAAIQIAAAITQQFPHSVIMHEDIEAATSKSRVRTITGWNSRMIERKYILRDKGINTDNFFMRAKLFCDQKVELAEKYPDKLKYFTGIIDPHGKPVYKLIPSVIILDSLPLLVPKDMTEEEKIAGNMSAAQVAKQNTQIFKRLAQPLKQANVILFVINHINQSIQINPYAPQAAQINYLKQSESLNYWGF